MSRTRNRSSIFANHCRETDLNASPGRDPPIRRKETQLSRHFPICKSERSRRGRNLNTALAVKHLKRTIILFLLAVIKENNFDYYLFSRMFISVCFGLIQRHVIVNPCLFNVEFSKDQAYYSTVMVNHTKHYYYAVRRGTVVCTFLKLNMLTYFMSEQLLLCTVDFLYVWP